MPERKLTDVAVRWMRACVRNGVTPSQVAHSYSVAPFIVEAVIERVLRSEVEDTEAPVKRCQCGRTYTFDQWTALPGSCVYDLPWGEVHDQRHCPCRSHIIIVLDEGDWVDSP